MRGQEPQSYEAQGARFEKAYQDVKQRIIHMITGLRPAMLNYGLYAALEELTDDLNERTYADLERKHPLAQVPKSELEPDPGSDPGSHSTSGAETEESWLTLVRLELEPAPVMLPPKVEEYLFRIVQQACENALRHSHARTVCISGSIANEAVDLAVVDDGVGFDFDPNHSYTTLLAEKHFGLVGMMERARSLGAELSIESQPGAGTTVRVLWKANQVEV
jgi:nitrate/nitrite-specific signal transduction histidine kinase